MTPGLTSTPLPLEESVTPVDRRVSNFDQFFVRLPIREVGLGATMPRRGGQEYSFMAIHAFGDDHSVLAHEALLQIEAYIGERTIARSLLTKIVLSSIAQGGVGLATVVDRALARLDWDGYL